MPGGYNDALRTAVEVVLRTGGTGEIDQARDVMVQLQAAMTSLGAAGPAAVGGIEEFIAALLAMARDLKGLSKFVDEYEASVVRASKATREWADMQAALGAAEARSAQEAQQAAQAVRDGTRAVEQRMQAIRSTEQAEGDALRSRAEGYARAERTEEHFAEAHRRAMESVRQAEGDAMRARIDAHARAERATEADAQATQQAAARIREADEGIARAEGMAAIAAEEAARKVEALGEKERWAARQTRDLDAALQGMHAHEAAAPRASTADLMGAGAAQRERIEALAAAERGTRQWAESMARLQEKFGPANNAALQYGRQILFVSYAMQDLYQSGFSAILNNVPQLAMAFNAPVAVMGTLAVGALGVDIALKALGPQLKAFVADLGGTVRPSETFVTTLDQAKIRLEALTKKAWKLEIDYAEIDAADRKLKEMEERKRAFEGAKEDEATREMARQAKGVSDTYGRDTLYKAIAEGEAAAGVSHAAVADEEMLKKKAEEFASNAAGYEQKDPIARALIDVRQRILRSQMAELKDTINKANQAFAEQEAGAFLKGDAAAIERMQNRAAKFPGRFPGVGPGGVTLPEALAAMPATKEEARRRAEEDREAQAREQAEADNLAAFHKARQLRRAAERKEDLDPNDPFNAVQQANAVWEAVGKPKREAAARKAKADARDAAAAQRQAADDVRDQFRDIAASNLDAGGRQQAIQGVANQIRAQAAQLGAEAVGDLLTEARAAFKAAAHAGDVQRAKDIRADQPDAQIHAAAAPIAALAAARGIPQARAQHDIGEEISRGLAMNLDFQSATTRAANMLGGYVLMMQQEMFQLKQHVQKAGANAHALQGRGRPPLQGAVPGTPW